ncbi:hypothetical protein POPTR_007G067850v4 [Populus trichocarpa]|uniref:Uncharacterized protein n=1 Tax=Populus trichocarpa TaxID=3694 RepID=A0ACC0SPY3_POPTR|nr:hypothetical protein POPTR_007G067850v4 [Populus trichocarpa]
MSIWEGGDQLFYTNGRDRNHHHRSSQGTSPSTIVATTPHMDRDPILYPWIHGASWLLDRCCYKPRKVNVWAWRFSPLSRSKKMQVQVKCSSGAENCQEQVAVELQGTTKLHPSFFQTHL